MIKRDSVTAMTRPRGFLYQSEIGAQKDRETVTPIQSGLVANSSVDAGRLLLH